MLHTAIASLAPQLGVDAIASYKIEGNNSMIRPIETHYAGCRFRSRLEARYAVFFDTLGVKWEYEREGYEVEDRLGLNDVDTWYYLPDFWLPEYELHVEVKGSFKPEEFRRFLSAAAYLSSPDGGCGGGNDTLILGPLPNTSVGFSYPMRLHLHKGDLRGYKFVGSRQPLRCIRPWRDIANDYGELRIEQSGQELLNGISTYPTPDFWQAYRAARSARFEHGEKG